MRYAIVDTAWGAFGFVAHDFELVETFLPQRRAQVLRRIHDRWPGADESRSLLPKFQQQVTDYFAGARTRFTVRLDFGGVTPFREAVFEACRRIRHGQTASYADLARAAGSAGAARAAGSAMANNPLPLVIPCHRVVCSDGSIGGFSTPQGVTQKKRLLKLENATRYADAS